jgi:hypothetical protein
LAGPRGTRPIGPRTPTWLPASAWLSLVVALGFLLVWHWRNPPFSEDSWAYYELSRHVDGNFFRIDTFRGYQSTEPYGMSFPPLWPLVIWCASAVTRLGPHAGYLAAFGCVIGTAGVIEALGRRLWALPGLGAVTTLGLLGFPAYVDEVVAARSFPLAVLLVCGLLWAVCSMRDHPLRRAVWAGVLAAGLVLTRSDTLLALVLMASAAILMKRVSWRQGVVAGAVLILVLVPWSVYGLRHFGALFVSDNTLIAMAVDRHYVLDVLDPAAVPTLFDDPTGWVRRVVGTVPAMVTSWCVALVKSPTVVLTVLLGGILLSRRARRWPMRSPVLALALICFAAQVIVAELTTGYLDERYLSIVVLLALFLALGQILQGQVRGTRHARASGALLGVALVALPAVCAAGLQTLRQERVDSLTGGPVGQELARCHDGTSTLVTLGVHGPRHGALTGRQTGFVPSNLEELSVSQRRDWIRAYDIGFFYVPPWSADVSDVALAQADQHRASLAAAAALTRDACAQTGQLYRISTPS